MEGRERPAITLEPLPNTTYSAVDPAMDPAMDPTMDPTMDYVISDDDFYYMGDDDYNMVEDDDDRLAAINYEVEVSFRFISPPGYP